MSRLRLVIVLSTSLVVLLSIVILRAETTRINYEISQLESRAEALRLELREKELELARYRDPARIRDRLAQHRIDSAPPPEKKPPPAVPKPRRSGRT
ncbi:MAG: hypothetical protein ACKVS9_14485 [Phycisphaerae bacterium]